MQSSPRHTATPGNRGPLSSRYFSHWPISHPHFKSDGSRFCKLKRSRWYFPVWPWHYTTIFIVVCVVSLFLSALHNQGHSSKSFFSEETHPRRLTHRVRRHGIEMYGNGYIGFFAPVWFCVSFGWLDTAMLDVGRNGPCNMQEDRRMESSTSVFYRIWFRLLDILLDTWTANDVSENIVHYYRCSDVEQFHQPWDPRRFAKQYMWVIFYIILHSYIVLL